MCLTPFSALLEFWGQFLVADEAGVPRENHGPSRGKRAILVKKIGIEHTTKCGVRLTTSLNVLKGK